ncbi:callose synthase 12-like protein, partial [Tanacetum coccineum]
FNLMPGDELFNTRGSLKSKFKDALNSLKLRYGLGGHLWYKIGKNKYRGCAVIEAFDNVRHLLLVHAALIKLVGLLVKPKKDFSNVVTSLQAIYEIAAWDFFEDKRTMGELKMAGLAPNRPTSGIRLLFENAVELRNLKCTNCNKIGHTVERCYDIIGYPPGYVKRIMIFKAKLCPVVILHLCLISLIRRLPVQATLLWLSLLNK